MHALCARRVPGHAFPGHVSYAELPVQYHSAFSWIVGFFVLLTDAPSVCPRVKWECSSWPNPAFFVIKLEKMGQDTPP